MKCPLSHESILDQVWRCIGEEVGIIGLYGMGGVGKMTLLTQINNKFVDAMNDVDVVIWVVVSKDLNLEKIQENIGKKIGLNDELWKIRSIEEKALDIFKILRKKKFVLLLDDIWERVNLIKVGVPLPSSKITSNIIFTTRSLDVCGQMEVDKKFEVKCLAFADALKLFQERVGRETLDIHPGIPELTEIVVKECGGLPLSLITIGRAMAYKKTPKEWNFAIQVLTSSASKFPGLGKDVFPLLKFSYDSLPSDTIRYCLLYCSLFPQDFLILKRDLVDCWIGEGFLDEYDGSEARNQGYYIISSLLHACLLEEVEDYGVKMHDVICDMVLWITYEFEIEKEKFLVKAGVGLAEAPDVRTWEGVRRISLMCNQIENLSEIPTCPHLLTLFLNQTHLKTIHDNFFQFMPSLKVLNLSSNAYLTNLPSGISDLVSLQHLDISWTGIKELPIELKALVNLKYQNLEHTCDLRKIPRELISNFLVLRVLRMYQCKILGKATKDSVLYGSDELLVEELLHLKHLNVLTISLSSFQALQKLLCSFKLQSCTQCLFIEDLKESLNVVSLAGMKQLNELVIFHCTHLGDLKINSAGELKSIRESHRFDSLQDVRITSCFMVRDLTWLILAPNLKRVLISHCFDIEEIISVGKSDEVVEMMRNVNVFAKLEMLVLQVLPNLKIIFGGALPLPHLKEIRVSGCTELKRLPLDKNSAKEGKIVIEGEEHWWKELKWEDQATQNAFLPCFKPHVGY